MNPADGSIILYRYRERAPVQLVHWNDGDPMILAEKVERAEGFIAKGIGLMGRSPLEPGDALVFPFSETGPRHVHTMFVRAPIDVLWVERECVETIETMDPWSLGRRARADTIIELPAGQAREVSPGDRVTLDRMSQRGN